LSKDIAAYISYDNQKVGQTSSAVRIAKVPQGKFILMNGPPSDNNAILFKAGQEEVLAPGIKNGKARYCQFRYGDWGQLGAWMKLKIILQRNRKT